MPKTKEDRINTVMGGGRHVVILGAGASIASTMRNPEANGKRLPSMDNFIEVVGLGDIVDKLPSNLVAKNFETLYSNLHKANAKSDEILEIERRVQAYFGDMQLPDEPTIYDHLILSLRPKDLIATFNWDPFLYQAFCRCGTRKNSPYISFLHGCVALGYSEEDNVAGPANYYAREDGGFFEPTRLLYPVHEKNYKDDKFIVGEWDRLKVWLADEATKRVTIFGYGAPQSDYEAVKLLDEAWGGRDKRNMEQFEIIDVRPEETVRKSWDRFIHSHHYDYSIDYFNSSLAHNPRRTSESYFQHVMPLTPDEAFSENNPIPKNIKTLQELKEWHQPLLDAEVRYYAEHEKDK